MGGGVKIIVIAMLLMLSSDVGPPLLSPPLYYRPCQAVFCMNGQCFPSTDCRAYLRRSI